MNVFTCKDCLPFTNRHKDWTREPILWDDHGQPLCHTQADEDHLLDELVHDGTLNPPDLTGTTPLSQLPNDAF